MKGDREGWWDAPAGDTWVCPKCGKASDPELWAEREIGCEDCGSHDGRECPECGEMFDHVWGAGEIADATAKAAKTGGG